MVTLSVLLFSSLVALLAVVIFYISRSLGHGQLRLRKITFFAVHHLCYSSKICTITARGVNIDFCFPRPEAPYWAIVTVDDYEYEDDSHHVSLGRLSAKLWFFPVFFRFTAGSLVQATLEDFRIRIKTSEDYPIWVERIRNNLIYTILNGETVRLHSLETRLFFSSITGARDGYKGEVEKPGLGGEEAHDELRVRCTASQWHIVSPPWNIRMYSFGDVEAEMRRSWVEDRGSFVMIVKESRWTKVPAYGSSEQKYYQASATWQVLYALYCFPSDLVKICIDPASTVDLHVRRCDITFPDFRLRDAKILNHATVKLIQEYVKYNERHPGIMQEALVSFVSAVC